MPDFDPRDSDSRERDDGIHDHDDEWLTLGRGPGSTLVHDDRAEDDVRDRDDEWREDRDREPRERDHDRGGIDPRDVFMRGLDLPRGPERELVHGRDRDYALNGSESRTLSTVGAFRVVSERDLHDPRDDRFELRHLEDQRLIQRVALNEHERAVALTEHGRGLLERHRDGHSDHRQAFHAGADKARERTHDAQLYRAYLKAAERLQAREARIVRVELDRELKREYQRFLQERNRGDRDSDGRPDRTVEEIEEWAREHDLPYFDEQVHFPDVRIDEEPNGVRWEDLEVTIHYQAATRRPRLARVLHPHQRRPRSAVRSAPRRVPGLPQPAMNWNIDQLTAQRTEAVSAFGFTERQARFLVEVLIHSGVFVERQYCAFAGITHGQKTHDFLRLLVERGYARPVATGALHRGRLFHVYHKPLYAAIGQADNRHRKPMAMGRMVERLMVLDAVLADRTFTWLGTESDKRSYFMRRLEGRVEPGVPRLTFGVGAESRHRTP